jgi:hypothetical protein
LAAALLAATRGFAAGDFPVAFLDVAWTEGFLAAAGFRAAGLATFLAAAFFAGFAADFRTGGAELRAFAPCFAPLPELFTFLGATHRLLATARPPGVRSYFDVAR